MKMISIICSQCKKAFDKYQNEYNRQVKVKGPGAKFYCGDICIGNSRKRPAETKQCKCGETFETSTGSSHCSTRCASLYSMTPKRLEAMLAANVGTRFTSVPDMPKMADGLRKREWDKYDQMAGYLISHEEPHQFEYALSGTNYIYDLALLNRKIFVEFDELYHNLRVEEDKAKDLAAEQHGWKVVRISVIGVAKPYPDHLLFSVI